MKKLLLTLVLFSLSSAQGFSQETLSGKLVVPAQAHTKESYLTGNFQLVGKSKTWLISSSSAVSEEELLKYKNQKVVITARCVPARAPHPAEQAPMGPDGPLKHPAYYQVLTIKRS